jgi:Alphavirus glycoprotein J
MLRRLILLSLALAALAIPAAPAVASVTDGYATPAGVSQTQVTDPTRNATASTSGSTLPFTGLDLGLMLVGGVVLLGGGLVLKRFTRRAPERL